MSRVVGHVRFSAQNGFHPLCVAGPVEVQNSVHVAVVGDPQSALSVGYRRGHQVIDARCTVQHGVLGVDVEVGKRVSHGCLMVYQITKQLTGS